MKRSIATGILAAVAAGAGLISGVMLASGGKAPKETASRAAAPAATVAAQGKRKILYWWDPMVGPSSISPKPGISAMGMKLVPVYASKSQQSPGEVTISPAIEQDLAVETSPIRFGPLGKTVRTVGYFRQATPVTYAVTMRVSGWMGTLYATTNGTAIRKGDPLFTLYSPQLLAAEEELLAASHNSALAARTHDPRSVTEARRLYQSIRRRLIFLGVSAAQLDRIVAQHKAREYLTFPSPVSGYLGRVSVRQKSFIKSGQAVMRIEQLSTVWLDAKVYDSQLPWVRLGEVIQARIAADPGRTFEGRIFFIDPNEDPRTHTVTVRARFANPVGLLRPGMYALVNIASTPFKDILLAPASAIIHTGTGEVALVAKGKGRFVPRKVTTGLTGSNGVVQVLSGLKAGERVVTSGQFLIDVESNMSEIITKFTAGEHPAKPPAVPAPKGRAVSGMQMPAAPTQPKKAAHAMPAGMKMAHPPKAGG